MNFSTSLFNVFCGRPHRQLTPSPVRIETTSLPLGADVLYGWPLSILRPKSIVDTDIDTPKVGLSSVLSMSIFDINNPKPTNTHLLMEQNNITWKIYSLVDCFDASPGSGLHSLYIGLYTALKLTKWTIYGSKTIHISSVVRKSLASSPIESSPKSLGSSLESSRKSL